MVIEKSEPKLPWPIAMMFILFTLGFTSEIATFINEQIQEYKEWNVAQGPEDNLFYETDQGKIYLLLIKSKTRVPWGTVVVDKSGKITLLDNVRYFPKKSTGYVFFTISGIGDLYGPGVTGWAKRERAYLLKLLGAGKSAPEDWQWMRNSQGVWGDSQP